jgi:hypothetical protein
MTGYDASDEELGAQPIMNGPERANHLAWCKQRALGEMPDTGLVISSLVQDLGADPRTSGSVGTVTELMVPLAIMGDFRDPARLRKFVLGFG